MYKIDYSNWKKCMNKYTQEKKDLKKEELNYIEKNYITKAKKIFKTLKLNIHNFNDYEHYVKTMVLYEDLLKDVTEDINEYLEDIKKYRY